MNKNASMFAKINLQSSCFDSEWYEDGQMKLPIILVGNNITKKNLNKKLFP